MIVPQQLSYEQAALTIAGAYPWGVASIPEVASLKRDFTRALQIGKTMNVFVPSVKLSIDSNNEQLSISNSDKNPDAWDTPLTKEETSRLRFSRSLTARDWWEFKDFGVRWGPALWIFSRVAPDDVWRFLKPRILRARSKMIPSEFGAWLKGVSESAKKGGRFVHPQWRWLVNLELLGGYHPRQDIDSFTSDIQDWVTGDVIHTFPGKSESEWLTTLRHGMDDFWAVADAPVPRFTLTMHDWIHDPGRWAGPGATHERGTVTVEGKKLPRSKWTTALTSDLDGLVERVLRPVGQDKFQHAKAIQKQELGKVRAIIGSDDITYLRMAYISHWLEPQLKRHPNTTLFYEKDQFVDMWKRLQPDGTVRVPLDQTHFDWQQNKRMLGVFFDSLDSLCQARGAPPDVIQCLQLLRGSIVDLKSFVEVGRRLIKVDKGVLSGWRWTALMDTVFNWAVMYCARQLVKKRIGYDPVIECIAQGDDDAVRVRSWDCAVHLVKAFQDMNFEINPSKFFVAKDRDEYLRQVAERKGVYGYPARAIPAILWRNPTTTDPVRGILRLAEVATSWSTLIGRGASNAKNLFLRDLAGAGRMSKEDADAVARTPRSLGGLGAFAPEMPFRGFSTGRVLDRKSLDRSNAPAILASLWGMPEAAQRWSSNVVAAPGRDVEFGEVKEVVLPKMLVMVLALFLKPEVEIVPHFREDLPLTARGDILRALAEEREWEKMESYLMPGSAVFGKRVASRGGRRVWVSWMLQDLPFSTPAAMGMSPVLVSQVFESLHKQAWLFLVSRSKFTLTDVVSASWTCERFFWSQVHKLPPLGT